MAIIGLAASIISFIDFGTKMVSLAKSVRDSPGGTIPEADDLNVIIQDIRSVSDEIRHKMPTAGLSRDEQRIVHMVTRCDELAGELSHILEKLKMRDSAWSKKMETVRVLLRAVWKKKEVDSLQKRLQDLDRVLRDSLNRALQM